MAQNRGALLLSLVAVLLTSCGGGTKDLENFIQETEGIRAPIKPLPGYNTAESFIYTGYSLGRDPFTRRNTISKIAEENKRRVSNRPLEPLEKYTVESFVFVGYITEPTTGRKKILLRTNDGEVHHAYAGDRIGTNNGKIKEANDAAVIIIENGARVSGKLSKVERLILSPE